MADLLVVGSVALDTVQTPFGKVNEALGGSATYFSFAASFFTQVRVVGGGRRGLPAPSTSELLADRGVDISGARGAARAEDLPLGRRVRLRPERGQDARHPARTCSPSSGRPWPPPCAARRTSSSPTSTRSCSSTCSVRCGAAAAHRARHHELLDRGQARGPAARARRVDVLADQRRRGADARREQNLIRAARAILAMGPQLVVIKRGEYGALLVLDGRFFFVPAYPLDSVFDPTGAGDTFAGGFMGYLARAGRLAAGRVAGPWCTERSWPRSPSRTSRSSASGGSPRRDRRPLRGLRGDGHVEG